MPAESAVIRDFIYIDADRLYSLYSQVFEGVAEHIVESVINSSEATDSQKGPLLQGSSVDTQVAEATLRTENKSLYDFMYSRLENRLGTAVIHASEITINDYREKLSEAFLVKVSGTAEIEDYTRLDTFMQRFNDLATAIGYSQTLELRKAARAMWAQKEEETSKISDRNKRAASEREISREKKQFEEKIQSALQRQGLHQEEEMLASLRLFIEIFNPQGFDITIVPSENEQAIVYRGVLDKRWLRVQPDLLRALYGTSVASKWTMVGKVTYLPKPKDDAIPAETKVGSVEEVAKESESADEDIFEDTETMISETATLDLAAVKTRGALSNATRPFMKDAFRGMFTAAGAFEEMFLESMKRVEILVAPLAIYHEVIIPNI